MILEGVTDVRHLKSKIRSEEDSKENSPWNIAADFTIDMSLSEKSINGMLKEYEADHHTGMDTEDIAKSIREYTNGYPFLVSRICQLIDCSFLFCLASGHGQQADHEIPACLPVAPNLRWIHVTVRIVFLIT
jgi:hypothetical protein